MISNMEPDNMEPHNGIVIAERVPSNSYFYTFSTSTLMLEEEWHSQEIHSILCVSKLNWSSVLAAKPLPSHSEEKSLYKTQYHCWTPCKTAFLPGTW